MTVFPVPWAPLAAVDLASEAPVHVSCDEQIEPSVVVEIEEERRHAPSAALDARSLCHIIEPSVTVVVIERVCVVTRYVEIRETVIVIVAHRDTHAISTARHSADIGRSRHVGERSVVTVAVETICEAVGLAYVGLGRHRRRHLRAVRKEEIEPAVIVVVQHRHAAAHRLDEVFLRRWRVFVREVDAAVRGHIDQTQVEWRARGGAK